MIRHVAAMLALLSLSGCAAFHAYPNTDIACVRSEMKYGGPGGGGHGVPFDMAMTTCALPASDDPLGMVNARSLPLDLRQDPELQRMAANPALNTQRIPYVLPNGKSSDGRPLTAEYAYPRRMRDAAMARIF